jgi:hypothetical protein
MGISPGKVSIIIPLYSHIALDIVLRRGPCVVITVGDPEIHGPIIFGKQGAGFFIFFTIGCSGETHSPIGGILRYSFESLMDAKKPVFVMHCDAGNTLNGAAALEKEHLHNAICEQAILMVNPYKNTSLYFDGKYFLQE